MSFRQERFGLYVFGLLSVCAFLAILLSIFQGGLFGYIKIIALSFPFCFVLILNLRPYWHVAYFSLIASGAMVFHSYGLEKFTPLLIVLGSTSIAVVLGYIMQRATYGFRLDTIDRWVLVLTIILTARMLYDRPGFVGLGSEKGGFMVAFTYVTGAWFYFIIRSVVGVAKLTIRQLKFVLVFALITIVWTAVFGNFQEGRYIGRRLTNAPTWLFCAVAMSLATTLYGRKENRFYLLSLFFLGVGVLSGYRSRIFFFLGEVLLVSKLSGRLKKTVVVLFIGGVIGIGGLIVSGRTPEAAERVLSLFTTIEYYDSKKMGGAMGWEDDFRLKLYEYAWDKIKEHPVAGNGFILDVSEAVGILTVYNEDAKIELLAFGGSYHNTILELAVKLGLPAAFIFCFIAVIIPYRLYRQLLVAPPGEIKTWGMALLAFWVANTGMLLMNGSSREFFACMVVNGFMAALSVAKQEELSPKNKRNMPVNNKELVVGAGR